MTNFEYYKKQILSVLVDDSHVALDVKGSAPRGCKGLSCVDCAFSNHNNDSDGLSCDSRRMFWLYEEYVEKPTITKKERAFLEACEPECYIARDMSGIVFIYNSKPGKGCGSWSVDSIKYFNISGIAISIFGIRNIFPFIKWEDEEPWKVEDLLKL